MRTKTCREGRHVQTQWQDRRRQGGQTDQPCPHLDPTAGFSWDRSWERERATQGRGFVMEPWRHASTVVMLRSLEESHRPALLKGRDSHKGTSTGGHLRGHPAQRQRETWRTKEKRTHRTILKVGRKSKHSAEEIEYQIFETLQKNSQRYQRSE